jgi:hypothetical protein
MKYKFFGYQNSHAKNLNNSKKMKMKIYPIFKKDGSLLFRRSLRHC